MWLAHPEALSMRDAKNLAAFGTEVDEPDAEHSLDLPYVDLGNLAFAVRADWRFRLIFDALDHAHLNIPMEQPPQL